jgi:acetolactate synthase-1/2/3 large subunit
MFLKGSAHVATALQRGSAAPFVRRGHDDPDESVLDCGTGNFALIDTLRRWGLTFFAGVNGGGLIHVAKYLQPFSSLAQAHDGHPRLLTMGEYVAGFIPVGYYLASGRVAGCMATTGAATKLASSGISDAKLHNVPAVYVFALNSTLSVGLAPLQDVSEYGMNIVPQLRAELGDGCVVIDSVNTFADRMRQAQHVLAQSRPVAISFHPDILSREVDLDVPLAERAESLNAKDLERFLAEFPTIARGRRVILYVGSEAARSEGIQQLTTRLAEVLQAPTVWSVNGANAVAPDNRYGVGYISFGGNDRAMELWRGVTRDDVVIALGFDAGEYSLNLGKIAAGHVWHFSALPEAYGHRNGDFRHRCAGEYRSVRGDIGPTLAAILPRLARADLGERPPCARHEDLNTRAISRDVRPDCVDFVEFYERLTGLWRPHSIGFDDVCTAYKDRQYVTQRPHPYVRFFTTHDGSAMGGGFGLGVGAKVADPRLHTFVFTGDGCWRLFGGALADAAHLDLRVFIVNNGVYAIVDKGLEVVVPEVHKRRYHSVLPDIDFVKAAQAHGWEGYRVEPDLANLADIIEACYTRRGRSILIDLPVDPDQVVGLNPRLHNLTTKTYL